MFAEGSKFVPVMSSLEPAAETKLMIRTLKKGRENGLGEELGCKQVDAHFSRALLQPIPEEDICGSFEVLVFISRRTDARTAGHHQHSS